MKITEAYRRQREVAYLDPQHGLERVAYAPIVNQMIDRLKVTELLDYWCGKASLARAVKATHEMKIQCYDPAVPGFSGDAVPMQMVACVDVLQDVEPECIDAVLDDLQRVTGVVAFISIRVGEEPGLIEKDKGWWLDKIMTRFDLQSLQCTPGGFYMIVFALPQPLIETVTVQ